MVVVDIIKGGQRGEFPPQKEFETSEHMINFDLR